MEDGCKHRSKDGGQFLQDPARYLVGTGNFTRVDVGQELFHAVHVDHQAVNRRVARARKLRITVGTVGGEDGSELFIRDVCLLLV